LAEEQKRRAELSEEREKEQKEAARKAIALGCVSVLFFLAVGALVFAFLQKNRADIAAQLAQRQLARTQIEEGRAQIDRAKLNSAHGDHFAAALMAARALGFAGYGREKIVDPKFNEEYPVLLTTASDPIDEQEARRQINDATYLGLPLWQTPVYRQHEGIVYSVAWSPDGKTLAQVLVTRR